MAYDRWRVNTRETSKLKQTRRRHGQTKLAQGAKGPLRATGEKAFALVVNDA